MSDLGINANSLTLSAYSIGATQSTSAVSRLKSGLNTDSTSQTDSTGTADNGQAADVKVSKFGQLYSKLQQLQTTDPAKYKQVLTAEADKLQEAAKSATGDDQKALSDLADKFTKAANGDLSALKPPTPPANGLQAAYQQNGQQGAQGGSHHHHGGHRPSSAVQQTLSSVFSDIDTALAGSSSSDSDTSVASTDA